ncbi:hypothetical protein HPB48_016551 [Haemaphysalis longicornis]|uniref:Uncharacterized protein n=1 Tax=Haemaphysalis longicornis TaxID=44386 RepID=A0A9J6GSK7_HAELO|nr:hypothetical protein HPB48_016551 [Haemaphysalis longicornis]
MNEGVVRKRGGKRRERGPAAHSEQRGKVGCVQEVQQRAFVEVGGYTALVEKFGALGRHANTTCNAVPENYMHLFRAADDASLPWPGMTIGLTINAIWYWCSDQVIVQRSLSAKNLSHAKAGSILTGYLKILPLFLMVFPGMAARVLFPEVVGCTDPEQCTAYCGNARGCTNIAYPLLVLRLMPAGGRGLMMSVMTASLVANLASISTALLRFSPWTSGIPCAEEQGLGAGARRCRKPRVLRSELDMFYFAPKRYLSRWSGGRRTPVTCSGSRCLESPFSLYQPTVLLWRAGQQTPNAAEAAAGVGLRRVSRREHTFTGKEATQERQSRRKSRRRKVFAPSASRETDTLNGTSTSRKPQCGRWQCAPKSKFSEPRDNQSLPQTDALSYATVASGVQISASKPGSSGFSSRCKKEIEGELKQLDNETEVSTRDFENTLARLEKQLPEIQRSIDVTRTRFQEQLNARNEQKLVLQHRLKEWKEERARIDKAKSRQSPSPRRALVAAPPDAQQKQKSEGKSTTAITTAQKTTLQEQQPQQAPP